MTAYQYKPDISVRLDPRVTKSMRALVTKVCRRYEMFEIDVLRLCLEAIVPEASARGLKWLLAKVPHAERAGLETYSAMVSVRTSRQMKKAIDVLARTPRVDDDRDSQSPDPGETYGINEILRYCFAVGLRIAFAEGFGPIIRMREKNL